MSDIDALVSELDATAAERASATANDDPNNYLLVVARLSHSDAKLMQRAADTIRQLHDRLERAVAGWRGCVDREGIRLDKQHADIDALLEARK